MGLIVLDSGLVIGVLNAGDVNHEASVKAVRDAAGRGHAFVVPASVYAEVLVDPFRAGPQAVVELDDYLAALPAAIEPMSAAIAKVAARLRAGHGPLRLSDALVIATAEALAADAVLTTNSRWPEVTSVNVRRIVGTHGSV